MSPLVKFLVTISALEIAAAVWIIRLIFPFYKIARETTGLSGREAQRWSSVLGLLTAVLLLFGALIATSIFWIIVLVTPSELRQPGTWRYGAVVVGFVAVQVMPLLTGMYLWRQMRQ